MKRYIWFLFVVLFTCGNAGGTPSSQDGECQPNCDGIHCGQDDGCGSTCRCREGFLCENGICKNQYGCIESWDPGCYDCECQECVCNNYYPDCCTEQWDEKCVLACKEWCGGCKKCTHQDCTDRECGPDPRCNLPCGECSDGYLCGIDGHCHKCVPDCKNKVCGPDGCGGSCGTCPDGLTCDEYGQCRMCIPHCEDNQCGPDGCGGTCGKCKQGEKCVVFDSNGMDIEYALNPPEPQPYNLMKLKSKYQGYVTNTGVDLSWKEGGSILPASICVPEKSNIKWECDKKEDCGPIMKDNDLGCCKGNILVDIASWTYQDFESSETITKYSVGVRKCPMGTKCAWNGKKYDCVYPYEERPDPHPDMKECLWPTKCTPHCESDWQCGPDECGGVCGECPAGAVCKDHRCIQVCTPHCDPKWQCGPDGCGGVCGVCPEGAFCVGHYCQYNCDQIPKQGCCQGNYRVECESYSDGTGTKKFKTFYVDYCGNTHEDWRKPVPVLEKGCGWSEKYRRYDCNVEMKTTPDGKRYAPGDNADGFPIWCSSKCTPDCRHKECGDDGCGGSCGSCKEPKKCWHYHCYDPEVLQMAAPQVEPVPDEPTGMKDAYEVHEDLQDVKEDHKDTKGGKNKDIGIDNTAGQKDVTGDSQTQKDIHNKGVPARPSSGGCNTSKGPMPSIWILLLMALAGLLLRRRSAQ